MYPNRHFLDQAIEKKLGILEGRGHRSRGREGPLQKKSPPFNQEEKFPKESIVGTV